MWGLLYVDWLWKIKLSWHSPQSTIKTKMVWYIHSICQNISSYSLNIMHMRSVFVGSCVRVQGVESFFSHHLRYCVKTLLCHRYCQLSLNMKSFSISTMPLHLANLFLIPQQLKCICLKFTLNYKLYLVWVWLSKVVLVIHAAVQLWLQYIADFTFCYVFTAVVLHKS